MNEKDRVIGILKMVNEFPVDHIAKLIDEIYHPTINCPECAGRGKIPPDYIEDCEDCEDCLGSGKIRI